MPADVQVYMQEASGCYQPVLYATVWVAMTGLMRLLPLLDYEPSSRKYSRDCSCICWVQALAGLLRVLGKTWRTPMMAHLLVKPLLPCQQSHVYDLCGAS